MPFMPGQSGNPAGKPKGTVSNKTRLRQFIEEQFTEADICCVMNRIHELSQSDDEKIALSACELFAAYAIGKPSNPVEISADPATLWGESAFIPECMRKQEPQDENK